MIYSKEFSSLSMTLQKVPYRQFCPKVRVIDHLDTQMLHQRLRVNKLYCSKVLFVLKIKIKINKTISLYLFVWCTFSSYSDNLGFISIHKSDLMSNNWDNNNSKCWFGLIFSFYYFIFVYTFEMKPEVLYARSFDIALHWINNKLLQIWCPLPGSLSVRHQSSTYTLQKRYLHFVQLVRF